MSIDVSSAGALLNEENVIAISTDVWACFLGAGEDLLPAFEPQQIGADGYVASVGINGSWNGHVILELPTEAAERAARTMIGLSSVTSEDVTDAVGELVNMIGGNLKGVLETPAGLTLPMVFKGAGAPAAGRDVVSTCTTEFNWLGQPVRISVWESSHTENEE